MENSIIYEHNKESISTISLSSNPLKTNFKPLCASSPVKKNHKIKNQHSIHNSTKKRKLRSNERKKRIKKNDETQHNNEIPSTLDQVDSVTNENDSSKNNIEQNQTIHSNSNVIYNNYKRSNNVNTMKNRSKDNHNYLNKTEILQMKLESKFFSENILPFLNNLQHNIIQLDNSIASNVTDIIKDINNVIELNTNDCINFESNENNSLTMPTFEPINFNSLNLFDNKLKRTKKIFDSNGSILNDKQMKKQYVQDKSENNLGAQKDNDYLEFNPSSYCHQDLKSSNSPYTSDDENSLIECEESDQSDHIRTLNKSKTLILPSCSFAFNKSSQEFQLENYSINDVQDDVVQLNCEDILEIKRPENKSFDSSLKNDKHDDVVELNNNSETKLSNIYPHKTGAPVKKRHFNHSHAGNVRTNREHQEGNQDKYNLRESPKPTDYFFAPFKFPSKKKKKVRANSYHGEDLYVIRKSRGNKECLHYKVSSVLKQNSNNLTKEIGIVSVNNECNIFRNSDMIPKKNKPCKCGIYPSQVPPSWSNTSHESIHQNLHKLRFESQKSAIKIKICENGLIYDIIKISQRLGDNRNLKLILKNINKFIDLELNFSKYNFNKSYHSIFLAVSATSETIGYLETEPLENACIYENNNLSKNTIAVKFGISKLWVNVKYRNCGVAKQLLKQFCKEENLKTNDIAFAFPGRHGISFIKNYFKNNSVLIY